MLDRILSLDRVNLFVFVIISLCVGTAMFLLVYYAHTQSAARLKQPRAIKLKDDVPPASHRRVRRPAKVFEDQMLTASGNVITKGDLFVLVNGDVPIPGTACRVISFDLTDAGNPLVVTRPLDLERQGGVRPARLHPDELLSAWARMEETPEEIQDDRLSGRCTDILPPAPYAKDADVCAGCGAKKFAASPGSPTKCVSCGTLFEAS